MLRSLVVPCSVGLSTLACFPAPKPDGDRVVGTSGIVEFGSDDAAYSTSEATAVPPSDDPGDRATTAGESTGAVEMPTSDDGSDGGTSGEVGEPGELPPGYPVDQPFGDDIRELDLVGRWIMPWDPAGVPHVVLEVADDGSFAWFERAADCNDLGVASGNLWVEGTQLVLAVDVWDKSAPWDTESAIGVAFDAPFRMRIGYTPMGGYLGLAGPQGLVGVAPWQGRSYARLDATVGATGVWAAESELWATPPGDPSPTLVVRDRFDAQTPEASTALVVHGRTWWWPEGPAPDADQQTNGPWSDDTPGNVAGAATIVGVLHAYDAVGLISFVGDRSFKLGVSSPCP